METNWTGYTVCSAFSRKNIARYCNPFQVNNILEFVDIVIVCGHWSAATWRMQANSNCYFVSSAALKILTSQWLHVQSARSFVRHCSQVPLLPCRLHLACNQLYFSSLMQCWKAKYRKCQPSNCYNLMQSSVCYPLVTDGVKAVCLHNIIYIQAIRPLNTEWANYIPHGMCCVDCYLCTLSYSFFNGLKNVFNYLLNSLLYILLLLFTFFTKLVQKSWMIHSKISWLQVSEVN